MRFSRLLKSLTRLNWRFAPPSKRDVLLYFKTGADVIAPYFSPSEFQILDLRESEVNIWVAMKCLLTRDLSAQNYARQFIRIAKPRLILTFIDNFPPFYLLKNEFPAIETWLIQNGVRSDRGDLFGLLRNTYSTQLSQVDKMFVFGSAIGRKYLEHIAGEIVVHGSFKNNVVPISEPKNSSVAYISTYRPNQNRDFVVPESNLDSPITYDQIISRREQAILWLGKYCSENNLQLTIVGKDESPEQEEAYYRSLLVDRSFEFVARKISTSSYKAIDQSEIVVFTSSTLGYEALARGKKTAALMLDAEIIGADALKFGWPAQLPSDGPFWTHQLDERRFLEIMDFLRTANDQDWCEIRTQATKDVISFDPGNLQFLNAIDSLRQLWQEPHTSN